MNGLFVPPTTSNRRRRLRNLHLPPRSFIMIGGAVLAVLLCFIFRVQIAAFFNELFNWILGLVEIAFFLLLVIGGTLCMVSSLFGRRRR